MTSCRRPLLLALGLALSCAGQAQACTAVPWPLATVAERLGVTLEGQVSQAWACKDSQGEHVVLATRQASPEPMRGQIQFLKYSKLASGWKRDWLARDFLPSQSAASGEIVLMKDVDGDGLAEVFVAYTVPGQAGEPDTGKLLVYYKDHKYAIRGAVARTADDFGSRKVDAEFLTLPASIQAQALQIWDRLSLPNGATKDLIRQAGEPPGAGRIPRR